MFESKVTLDQASFRALASETRVAILRALAEHPQTLTDLANRLNISKPGVMKHLDLLQEAGLVAREDPERKWIYYFLTTKGQRLLDPARTRILLSLGLSAAATLAGFLTLAYFVSTAPTSGNGGVPAGTGLSLSGILTGAPLLALSLLILGLIATAISFLTWKNRPTASDEQILSRLSSFVEESPDKTAAGAPLE